MLCELQEGDRILRRHYRQIGGVSAGATEEGVSVTEADSAANWEGLAPPVFLRGRLSFVPLRFAT